MQIRDLMPWSRENREDREMTRRENEHSSPVSLLQRDINRVFDEFWNRFDSGLVPSGMGLSAFGPSTDVNETDGQVAVTVELPGMSEKDVEVSLTDDMLTIRGEKHDVRTDDGGDSHMTERSYGAFYRAIPLPPGVDTEKASAEFRNGVLTVSLPKTEEARSRVKRIDVKAA